MHTAHDVFLKIDQKLLLGRGIMSSNSETICRLNKNCTLENAVVIIVAVTVLEGEAEVTESAMELIMEAFEMQCHANLQQAIRTVDGLGIEYDENVVCDVCRSVG